jgi:hypothetical protein
MTSPSVKHSFSLHGTKTGMTSADSSAGAVPTSWDTMTITRSCWGITSGSALRSSAITPEKLRKNSKIPSLPLDKPAFSGYNTRMNKKPRMTRAHFTFLAQFINDYAVDQNLSPSDHVILAARMQQGLKGTNPNFDGLRFLDAATKDLARDPQEVC